MSNIRRTATSLAKLMAVLGGLLLIFLIVMTCVSIVGRGFNTIGNMSFVKDNMSSIAGFLQQFAPITGDFELVEISMALAIFLFLPWCQLNRGHASVDLFTQRLLSSRGNEYLALIWEFLLVVITVVITWRLYAGMRDKMLYNETTFLLTWPVWWGYAACFIAGLFAVVVGFMSLIIHWSERKETIHSSEQVGP
ncbi:TRAP transporter small permease [Ahrensia kielensis]|uniref:TRAP transporter small permease n=1 Tax=Ahrensia kielensis TaxID=76980 RepID=UPI001B3B8D39|nr:TRAP transporter small permease [Ahrensia kielensis]